MGSDIVVGTTMSDYELPGQARRMRKLSDLAHWVAAGSPDDPMVEITAIPAAEPGPA